MKPSFINRSIPLYFKREEEGLTAYYRTCMIQYLIEDRQRVTDNWFIPKPHRRKMLK
jgi:hypothetical protein